ncbi:hypothetical protein [Micromonospora saelicesensis]|nr:hypothetical protein [Micromonospora saelicesensis]
MSTIQIPRRDARLTRLDPTVTPYRRLHMPVTRCEDWLPVIARKWLGGVRPRPVHPQRELELRAFVKAKVHMFLFPAMRPPDYNIELVRICALASARQPKVYRLRQDSVTSSEERLAEIRRRRS